MKDDDMYLALYAFTSIAQLINVPSKTSTKRKVKEHYIYINVR